MYGRGASSSTRRARLVQGVWTGTWNWYTRQPTPPKRALSNWWSGFPIHSIVSVNAGKFVLRHDRQGHPDQRLVSRDRDTCGGAELAERGRAETQALERLPELQEILVDGLAELNSTLVADLPGRESAIANFFRQSPANEGKSSPRRGLLAEPTSRTPPVADHLLFAFGELVLGDRLVIQGEEHIQFGGDPVLAVGSVLHSPALPALIRGALDGFPRRAHHCGPQIPGVHDPPAARSSRSESIPSYRAASPEEARARRPSPRLSTPGF